jgi:hypothetical protein
LSLGRSLESLWRPMGSLSMRSLAATCMVRVCRRLRM